jgi:hypothetical protein
MSAVLEHVAARRIAVITPYLDIVNERIRAYLAESGVSVEILSTFNARTTDELAAIQPAQIARRAREVMQPGLDAMFIACSQLPTRAIIPELERELGIPVWSSIRATAWQAERAMDVAVAYTRGVVLTNVRSSFGVQHGSRIECEMTAWRPLLSPPYVSVPTRDAAQRGFGRAVLPRQQHLVVLQQAIRQTLDRREVRVRDVLGALHRDVIARGSP